MDVTSLLQAGALVSVAFATALIALWSIPRITQQRRRMPEPSPTVAYLIEDGTLIDATEAGQEILDMSEARGSDLGRLVAALSPIFPDFPDALAAPQNVATRTLQSRNARHILRIRANGTKLRILIDNVEGDWLEGTVSLKQSAMEDMLSSFRGAVGDSPIALWKVDQNNAVTWAAGAYWELAEAADIPQNLVSGRLPELFPSATINGLSPGQSKRAQLSLKSEETARTYDITSHQIADETFAMAAPIDALVNAERSLREFLQTLTQTFAHLSVGLAIFNRKRELTLFNPALGDLLGFDVEFLVAKPSLPRFLDYLRQRHMMPEPKDYKIWRRKLSDLEAAAADGGQSETWSLADGRTLRITGRPHPDGAVAFLFEDISAEVSLNQAYQRELKSSRAVLNTLEEAVAVFSADGKLSFMNRAYASLWHDGDIHILKRGLSFLDASRIWQDNTAPNPVWGDARDFASAVTGRSSWSAEVRGIAGQRMTCRFEPLPFGETLVAFSLADETRAVAPAAKSQAPKPLTPKPVVANLAKPAATA
ncbi:MAG: PAS-domain containing protein [Pseudomonadota bacterium]